jgi:hypothetical protein
MFPEESGKTKRNGVAEKAVKNEKDGFMVWL